MGDSLFAETRGYILDRMRRRLAEGSRKMPTEKELAAEVLASYATVRLVMKELEQEGFVRRIRCSGTYLEPQAETLLEEAAWPRLRLFTSPVGGKPDDDYAAWLVEELRREARRAHRRVVHTQVRTHDEFLAGLERSAEPGDAVVYLPPTEAFTMRQLGVLGKYDELPLIVIDCELGNINVGNIATDNRRGGMIAARALLESGCRDLAVLLCEPMLRQSAQRLQGFLEIAELSGLEPAVIDCEVRVEDDRAGLAYAKMLAVLKSGRRPDGVFAISDCGALAAAEAIREFGLEPGRDIALIGFDGLAAGRRNDPPLTSVAQPVGEICREVFRVLQGWKAGNHEQRLLSPVLQPGGTLWKINEKFA